MTTTATPARPSDPFGAPDGPDGTTTPSGTPDADITAQSPADPKDAPVKDAAPKDAPAVPASPAGPAVLPADGTQRLLVVVKAGKIVFNDPAVVVVDVDDAIAPAVGSDTLYDLLKDVASTRPNDGRARLARQVMEAITAKLDL